jgi:hypothetical protein
LWITEFGIWPSFENRHLFRRLRASYGETRDIQDAPGHLLELPSEHDDLISYLDIALQFGWGGYLLVRPTMTMMFFSHDGWLRLRNSEYEALLPIVASKGLPFEVAEDAD